MAVMDFNSLNSLKMPRSYSSSKVKQCLNALLYSFSPSIIILHPPSYFAQRNNSHDPLSGQTNTILRRERRRFIMSCNMEPEQRTTESHTLSSSKKPENYRVSLFLSNSRATLAKTRF